MNELAIATYGVYNTKNDLIRNILIGFIVGFSVIIAIAIIFFPDVAYAGAWEDFAANPFGFICKFVFGSLNKMFCEMINGAYWAMMKYINAITPSDLLTGNWSQLFGDKGAASTKVYSFMTTICSTIVKPIAGSILSCVFLMQFLKLASKADQNGTVPLLKDILVLFMFFMIFNWLVGHADTLCGAIYDVINTISIKIKEFGGGVDFENITEDLIHVDDWNEVTQFADVSFGSLISILICVLLGFLGGIVAFLFACIATYARALQLYVYATFSPIPFAMLGFEETRSWGVGYFKNFAAVALAGAILLFIMFAFPAMMFAVISFDTGSSMMNLADMVVFNGSINGALNILKMLAIIIVFIMGIIKSGTWAKDILGS